MNDRFDRELSDAMEALRADDRTRVPPFEALLDPNERVAAARSGRLRRSRRYGLLALAAAASVAALVLRPPSEEERFEALLAGASEELGSGYAAPTDFLMAYPGREFYTVVPTFSAAPNPLALEGPEDGAPANQEEGP